MMHTRLCLAILICMHAKLLLDVLVSVQVVRAVAVVLALAELFQILNGRKCNMSANVNEYMELFGEIHNEAITMARCACVSCNSCTCACSCRAFPYIEEIEW